MTAASLDLPFAATRRTAASGRKYAIVVFPQSGPSLTAERQSVTSFGSMSEMVLPAMSDRP